MTPHKPLPLAATPATSSDGSTDGPTTIGGYFVSNYPPFDHWHDRILPEVNRVLDSPPETAVPLGLYVHIPFCRKRCRFCYFKVYTERNASEVADYVGALGRELALHAGRAAFVGRKPSFVYFGGGTPSYLSTEQLGRLGEALQRHLPWDAVEEVTFECEPGTITEGKLRALRAMGVTRLSLGVESFDDRVLEENGRAHLSRQVYLAFAAARAAGLPQINLDLIDGLLGDSEESWDRSVEETIALGPESITIYQMELPRNALLSRELGASGLSEAPVADWPTKRARLARAFSAMEARGYRVFDGYTAVKVDGEIGFRYRERLWRGADLLGIGVSAFSHVGGVHFQNEKEIEHYLALIADGVAPIRRGLALSDDERLVREVILQLKLGGLRPSYFQRKFGVELRERFAIPLGALEAGGMLVAGPDALTLTRDALLRVDALLPAFYRPEHRA